MGVKNVNLTDFIALTLNDLPKQKFEVTWTNQDYEFCRIYQNDRMVIDGGNEIERKVMLSNTGRATYCRLFDTASPAVGDVMHTIKVGWTQLRTDYSWDKLEILRNRNSAKQLVDLMKVRRTDGLWSLADLIEQRGWLTPTSSTDDLYPYGIPYYLRMMNSDTVVDGFVGQTIRFQDTTESTVCAGIDSATEANWRNYAALYTNVDNAFLKTFRKAFIKTQFKAPIIVSDPGDLRAAQKRIYCDSDIACELMDLADAKDDNHRGKDVLGNLTVDNGSNVYLNRLAVVSINQLEGVTDPHTSDVVAPIYCVDFKYFQPYVQADWWMEESEPMIDRSQPTTVTVYLFGSHQNLCSNVKRAGFVVHKAITG